jgi:hypothetical protein
MRANSLQKKQKINAKKQLLTLSQVSEYFSPYSDARCKKMMIYNIFPLESSPDERVFAGY